MSAILYKPPAIFIHVPKTAGSAMERTPVFAPSSGHLTMAQVFHYVLPTLPDFPRVPAPFPFAFVRNPLDRLVSIFHHRPHDAGLFPSLPRSPDGFARLLDHLVAYFPDGVDAAIPDHLPPPYSLPDRWPLHHHFLPQHYFITWPRDYGVTVFRYEDLPGAWTEILQRLGADSPSNRLPPAAPNNRLPLDFYYTPRTRAIAVDLYRRDCELWYHENFDSI